MDVHNIVFLNTEVYVYVIRASLLKISHEAPAHSFNMQIYIKLYHTTYVRSKSEFAQQNYTSPIYPAPCYKNES